MKVTRRSVVKGAMAAPMITTPGVAFGYQANSAVSFGILGTGGRGRYVGNHMVGTGLAKVSAICDIHGDRIDLAKTHVPGGDSAKVYRDYRDLLSDDNVDAVLITTPVFLHADHFEAAIESGKHIYAEKPAAPDVARVRRIDEAGRKADPKIVVQWGYQQRFSPEYLKCMEYLNSGRIGEVKLALSYWILGNPPPTSFKSPYVEEGRKERHWQRWTELSGGPLVEQDCHGVDMLNWYLKGKPLTASGKGGLRYPVVYGDWTSDHHDIIYTYPEGKEGWLISIKNAGAFRSVKEQMIGSHGVIETARTYYKLHGPKKDSNFPNADELEDRSQLEKVTSKREITIDAVEHFYQRIQAGKPYNMTNVAVESTATAILGRMAYEYNREVTWEEMWRDV